ncbi:MAG: hypothetical protein OEY01_11140 [Desulfobulbaceae bacterium]|nr:hypothetical protein [Desulfobulbaceae bacterium]
MSLAKVLGFNIRSKFNGKYLAGVTNHSFNLEPKLKDSIMKSDQGNKQQEVDGRIVTFNASMYIMKDATGSASGTYMDIGDIRETVAAGTTGTYEYGGNIQGDHLVTGTCRMVKLGETTDSENFGTASVDFSEIEGTGGFGTQS